MQKYNTNNVNMYKDLVFKYNLKWIFTSKLTLMQRPLWLNIVTKGLYNLFNALQSPIARCAASLSILKYLHIDAILW